MLHRVMLELRNVSKRFLGTTAVDDVSFSIDRGEKGYYALLMLLDTGMMGVFVSLDFFLFFVFWFWGACASCARPTISTT